ncbi:hypothetical protein GQR58_009071 [Nymphon striatum]|nr:hypothetical protein GQR58_009071 [Nymphon striatum]
MGSNRNSYKKSGQFLIEIPIEFFREDAVLVATFSAQGVEAEIEFFVEDEQTMARALIQRPRFEEFSWTIHNFPPNYQDVENPCGNVNIGPVYIDLSQYQRYLQSDSSGLIPLPGLKLSLDKGIMGRSLVLENRNKRVCALIRPSISTRTFLAKFYSPIGGTVYINQATFGSAISSNLYYTDGSRKVSMNPWNIVEFGKKDTNEKIFHKEYSKCKILKKTKNLVKLSQFLGNVSIGQSNAVEARSHFVDPLLDPLEEKTGSLYLIIYSEANPKKIMACGMIQELKKRVAQATFDAGVLGYVRLEQDSPFVPTLVMVGLDDLDQRAVNYGIDELPAFRSSKGSCATLSRRMYNPYNANTDTPRQGTNDQYPLGDISGKHGSLLFRHDANKLYIDNNIPLFGSSSVAGRSVVIYDEDGTPIACANLKRRGVEMVTAVASFNDGPLKGQLIFRQPKDNPKAETTIYVILYHAERNFSSTSSHAWHISDGRADSALGKSTTDCKNIGNTLNPYKAYDGGAYSCQCNKKSPMRCAIGDVSGKVGPLKLTGLRNAVDPSEPGRYLFTDSTLSLAEPTSIVNKTVVIYNNIYGEKIIACSNIIQISERNFAQSTGV